MDKKEETQSLAVYLKTLRRACRYKQDFVAAQLNIARQTYSHYETGRIKPPALALYKLANLYGVSVEGMFSHMGGDGYEPEQRFLRYFRRLDESDREDILSIMEMKIDDREKGEKT